MNRRKQNFIALIGLLGISLILTGVSWGVRMWRVKTSHETAMQEDGLPTMLRDVAGFPAISFKELQKITAEKHLKKEVLILDARADFFYEGGHVFGALNLDSGEFDNKFPLMRETLLRARQVIVYCSDRQCQSSKILAQKLQAAGVKNISIYSGGWEEWRKRKGAIEK